MYLSPLGYLGSNQSTRPYTIDFCLLADFPVVLAAAYRVGGAYRPVACMLPLWLLMRMIALISPLLVWRISFA